MSVKVITVRLPEDIQEKMQYLTKRTSLNMSSLIKYSITQVYNMEKKKEESFNNEVN